MSSALTAHTQVEDACAQLTRQAPTRQRAIWLACANVAFWIAAVFSYLQISALSNLAVMPHGALEAGHVAVGKTTDLTAPPDLRSTPSAPASESTTAASAPTTAPSSALASAPAAPTAAASAASAPAAPVASAPVAAASTALPASAPATPVVAVSAPAPRTVASVPATKTSASKAASRASAPAKAERDKKEVEPTVVRTKKTQAPATTETPKRKASGVATAIADATDKPYFINVGLFAIPENAASAHAKLLEAQLPSVLKELKSTKGRQIRVRVGPYRSKTDAQAAVEKIKALQLDAVIVQP